MEPQAPQSPSPEAAPRPIEQSPETTAAQPEAAPVAPTPEKQTGARESVNQGPGTQLPQVNQPDPVPVSQNPAPAPQPADQSPASSSPAAADDVDVLEKEWVDKAKEIVEKTKSDPYEQNKEVNALKADYMKKRYGKEIKLSDS